MNNSEFICRVFECSNPNDLKFLKCKRMMLPELGDKLRFGDNLGIVDYVIVSKHTELFTIYDIGVKYI